MENNEKTNLSIDEIAEQSEKSLKRIEQSIGDLNKAAEQEVELSEALEAPPMFLFVLFLIISVIIGLLYFEKERSGTNTIGFLALVDEHRHTDVLDCYATVQDIALQIAGGSKTTKGVEVLAAENIDEVEKVIEEAAQIIEDDLPLGLPEAARPTLPSNLP